MKTLFCRIITGVFAIIFMTCGAFASSYTSESASTSNGANQSTEDTIWRITTDAHILKVDNDSVWVHMQSPDIMKINENDIVQPMQRLPRSPQLLVAHSANHALSLEKIVPGQKVTTTFTYRFVGSSRLALPIQCERIVVKDPVLTIKSTKELSKLKENHIIASILEINHKQATIFVEGGRPFYPSNTTYTTVGKAVVNVELASVKDVAGNTISLSALKKYDRVLMKTKNNVWNETEPPSYVGGDVITLQVLGAGENIIVDQ